jgi:hypothetical protein
MMAGIAIHCGLSVRGAIHRASATKKRSYLKGMFKHPSGTRSMTPDEAFELLLDELSKGHEVLPFSDSCKNWDWKHGCRCAQVARAQAEQVSGNSGDVTP